MIINLEWQQFITATKRKTFFTMDHALFSVLIEYRSTLLNK